MSLAREACVPCKKGEGKLSDPEVAALMLEIPGWERAGAEIVKTLKFKNFVEALAFVNRIGALAEAQGHHPDITFGWGYVHLRLSTHSAGGLTRNDFVLAAKIDGLG